MVMNSQLPSVPNTNRQAKIAPKQSKHIHPLTFLVIGKTDVTVIITVIKYCFDSSISVLITSSNSYIKSKQEAIALNYTIMFSSSFTHLSFFTQRVINVWICLLMSVAFGSLGAFNKSIERVNLNQFLTVYKFPLVCLMYFCSYCRCIFVSYQEIRKLTVFLTKSDISAGNSISVPRLTAVSLSRISVYKFVISEIN